MVISSSAQSWSHVTASWYSVEAGVGTSCRSSAIVSNPNSRPIVALTAVIRVTSASESSRENSVREMTRTVSSVSASHRSTVVPSFQSAVAVSNTVAMVSAYASSRAEANSNASGDRWASHSGLSMSISPVWVSCVPPW
jgi:hypothetical protein